MRRGRYGCYDFCDFNGWYSIFRLILDVAHCLRIRSRQLWTNRTSASDCSCGSPEFPIIVRQYLTAVAGCTVQTYRTQISVVATMLCQTFHTVVHTAAALSCTIPHQKG